MGDGVVDRDGRWEGDTFLQKIRWKEDGVAPRRVGKRSW